jgi:hypothetical protein
VPLPTYSKQLAAHTKEVKAKRMIMDAVKDHLIPHLSKKKTKTKMFDALVNLYRSENMKMKMILQNKIKSIEMIKSDSNTSYLMKVMQIHGQLAIVGEKIVDVELMKMGLNGFPTLWEPFVKVIRTWENSPDFERP